MSVNNTIHIISFTPRKYTAPVILLRDYLRSENNEFIMTEDGIKIRL